MPYLSTLWIINYISTALWDVNAYIQAAHNVALCCLRLKSPVIWHFSIDFQANKKENSETPHYWPIVLRIQCWPSHNRITGVKQCTFQCIISNDIAQKEMVFNGLVIHHFIVIACISYEIIFTISLPRLINIAPIQTCVIRVTVSIRH